MKEVWKTIPGYSKYEASTLGRIRNKKSGRPCKQHLKNSGYLNVKIYDDNGNNKNVWVHRAIATTFIPNPDNLPQVSHLDEGKTNNQVDNLKWSTIKDNCNMPLRGERITKSLGYPIRCIETNTVYDSLQQAQTITGIHNICRVIHGKRKTAGGYHWEYINDKLFNK